MKERLAFLINEFTEHVPHREGQTWEDAFADFLLENGVIVPPCKVGDTVYHANYTPYGGEIRALLVTNIIFETNGVAFDERAIGESIFITKEEAEKACQDKYPIQNQHETNPKKPS